MTTPDEQPPSLRIVSEPPGNFDLEEVVAETADVLAAIRELHHRLAISPDPGGPVEAELAEWVGRRDRLVPHLGVAILRVLASGGTVHAVLPDVPHRASEPVAPAPAPDEVATTPEPVEVVPPPTPTPLPKKLPAVAPARRVGPPLLPPAPGDLDGLLAFLGRPREATDDAAASELVERLEVAIEDLDGWLTWPTPVQHALTGIVASLARHVQDESGVELTPDALHGLNHWFSRMTKWSKTYKPGFVRGLSRNNAPDHATWLADALSWWTQLDELRRPPRPAITQPKAPLRPTAPPLTLTGSWAIAELVEDALDPAEALRRVERAVGDASADLGSALQAALDAGVPAKDPKLLKLLVPVAARVAKAPGLKTLKANLKAASRAVAPGERQPSEESESAEVPASWPFFSLTEGLTAVILGGDPRSEVAERAREAFRFASCVWEEKDGRRVEALARRIRAKSIDLVILLRGYLAHGESDVMIAACKETGVPFAIVESGYGITAVKLGIERFLRGRLPSVVPA